MNWETWSKASTESELGRGILAQQDQHPLLSPGLGRETLAKQAPRSARSPDRSLPLLGQEIGLETLAKQQKMAGYSYLRASMGLRREARVAG